MIRFILSLIPLLIANCTDAPSGAIEYNSTVYYLDGKFHKDIPEQYIHKIWGYRIEDAIGNQHTYRDSVKISHQRKETKWCTIHRQSEVIKAMYNGKHYIYWVARHKKSL